MQLQTKKNVVPLIYEFLERKLSTKPRSASSFMYLVINLFRSIIKMKIASSFTSVSLLTELVSSRPANLSFFMNTRTFSKLCYSTPVLILKNSLANMHTRQKYFLTSNTASSERLLEILNHSTKQAYGADKQNFLFHAAFQTRQ